MRTPFTFDCVMPEVGHSVCRLILALGPPQTAVGSGRSSVAVTHRSRVGGVKVRWLREREECLRNHLMGCLSVANRMHGSPKEGVVNSLASPARRGVALRSSPGYFRAGQPFSALTLWNSSAASR